MEKSGIKQTTIPHLYHVNYADEGQTGFLVKVHRSKGNLNELFSFSQYPTKRACFLAARRRAREVDKIFPCLTRREYAQIRRSNFTNKEVGVRKLTKPKGSKYKYWEASWSPRVGVVRKKLFAVARYGDKKAHELARVARAEALASMAPRNHEKRGRAHGSFPVDAHCKPQRRRNGAMSGKKHR